MRRCESYLCAILYITRNTMRNNGRRLLHDIWHKLYHVSRKCMMYYTIAWHVIESHDVLQNDMMSYTIVIWHVTELYDILHNCIACYRITWRITEWYDVLHDYMTRYRIIWYITQSQDMLQNHMTYFRMIWYITRLYDTLQNYMIYYTIARHVTELHDYSYITKEPSRGLVTHLPVQIEILKSQLSSKFTT